MSKIGVNTCLPKMVVVCIQHNVVMDIYIYTLTRITYLTSTQVPPEHFNTLLMCNNFITSRKKIVVQVKNITIVCDTYNYIHCVYKHVMLVQN